MILVEKEWLSFGHQFGLRNGIYTKEIHEDQRAPVFLQWLDCVHQLIFQFPNAFEFNMEFLLYLADQSSNNLYGTFLFNCPQERLEKNIPFKTLSVWADILNDADKIKNFTNPFYEKQNHFLIPSYSPHRIRFWEEYFLKWNTTADNQKIFLDYEKNVYVKNTQNFFIYHKIMEKINEELSKKKVDELYSVLTDIYLKTYNTEIFDEFSETTKFYLSNINLDINDANPECQNKQSEIEKKTVDNNIHNEIIENNLELEN